MNTSSIRSSSALALALSLAGCEEPLEPGTKVDSFRVLAEQVDQPFAHPGETVQLRSLSHDPEDRPVMWAWASCVNPASSDLEGCLEAIASLPEPDAAVFAFGLDRSEVELAIPEDAISSLPSPARAAASVGVVSAACPGELSLGQGPGGLPFRCLDSTGRDLELDEFIIGMKRISVRESDRNQNPLIATVEFDGEEWPVDEVKEVGFCNSTKFVFDDCPERERHDLNVLLAPESFERGTDEHGEPFEEQLVLQFYATEGIFEYELKTGREPENAWVARKAAAGQTLTLWFVARDNRGGVSWTDRQVRVRPAP
jgi:hypothetical protein